MRKVTVLVLVLLLCSQIVVQANPTEYQRSMEQGIQQVMDDLNNPNLVVVTPQEQPKKQQQNTQSVVQEKLTLGFMWGTVIGTIALVSTKIFKAPN